MAVNQRLAKHWGKLILRPEYRKYCQKVKELEKLKNAPRYKHILGKSLSLVDGQSFYYSYWEIFEQEIYCFSSHKKEPLIVDCGSNVL
ncbi:MAG: hypothetical protein BRC41_12635 [Cyanobacteria bacterium QH_9_48_43]|nr:MAG: hypothetical protein BRC41_12635 [Cyanobacteria bacterium QH_9_48_43]